MESLALLPFQGQNSDWGRVFGFHLLIFGMGLKAEGDVNVVSFLWRKGFFKEINQSVGAQVTF